MVDSTVLQTLEAGFQKLQDTTPKQCHSLLKKHLTRQVLSDLENKTTSNGATLLDVVQSGFANLDSSIGTYAADAESYTVFKELFDPIIDDYHLGFKSGDKHPDVDFGDAELDKFVDVDPEGRFVVSTRIRCARNLDALPFNPLLSEKQYGEIESKAIKALEKLEGDLAGTYFPLGNMSESTQKQMAKDHFLFTSGDRFLEAAKMCRYWPEGRGIFCNKDKTFLVWVNEEDAFRIISMEQGGNIRSVYTRFAHAAEALDRSLKFARSNRLGFLTNCPSNLGTAIRASVLIKLPLLVSSPGRLKEVAARYKLQVRGTNGEHSESEGGIFDVSNLRRLGLTEFEAVKEMMDGVVALIEMEKEMEKAELSRVDSPQD